MSADRSAAGRAYLVVCNEDEFCGEFERDGIVAVVFDDVPIDVVL